MPPLHADHCEATDYGPGSSRPHGLTWQQFSSPQVLDYFLREALQVLDSTAEWRSADTRHQLWLGETSSTFGGGTANASSSFIAGFLWLDKLGLAARLGHSVVCRQVFAHGDYAAIGNDDQPNPDYFSSLLWTRLVGRRVLDVAGGLKEGRTLRLYAFCAASPAPAGAVTLVFLNTQKGPVDLELGPELGGPRQLYVLTSTPGVLISRDILLNEALLAVDGSTGELPSMEPRTVGAEVGALRLPASSYGFIVLPTAAAPACRSANASRPAAKHDDAAQVRSLPNRFVAHPFLLAAFHSKFIGDCM